MQSSSVETPEETPEEARTCPVLPQWPLGVEEGGGGDTTGTQLSGLQFLSSSRGGHGEPLFAGCRWM